MHHVSHVAVTVVVHHLGRAMGRLDGKVIVLSAAAQGIGRAAAIVMTL